MIYILKIGFSIIWSFISFLKYPFYLILFIFLLFCILCFFNVVIGFIKGKRFKKGTHNKLKKHSILRRLFIDLPHQYVNDLFDKNPDFFNYQGLVIFEGRQGSGKTTSMIEFASRMQEEYPLCKCITNLGYTNEDTSLTDWRMLINYKNGIRGVVVCMDELQNWFSSNDSKNFPPEMLEVITQNRKNRRIILGTAQNFYLLSKAIRTQTTEVRRCTTLLGCLTIVRRFEPILDAEGNVAEFKKRGMYFFVHNEKLRKSFDTFKVIKRFVKVGFKDEQAIQDVVTNTYILNNKRK